MKSLFKNIKNLLPYLLLIAIYFFFVNFEARRNQENYPDNNNSKVEKDLTSKDKLYNNNSSIRISIPVIPYSQ